MLQSSNILYIFALTKKVSLTLLLCQPKTKTNDNRAKRISASIAIQSLLNIYTADKKQQETFSLRNTGDFFKKIVVLDSNAKQWTDEDGVIYIGVIPFLLEDIFAK